MNTTLNKIASGLAFLIGGYLIHPSDFFGFYAEIPTRGLSFSPKVGSAYF